MRMTERQRRYLRYLETRRGPISEATIRPQHIAMLRIMEEGKLVRRNLNAEWSITPAGRRALEPR